MKGESAKPESGTTIEFTGIKFVLYRIVYNPYFDKSIFFLHIINIINVRRFDSLIDKTQTNLRPVQNRMII